MQTRINYKVFGTVLIPMLIVVLAIIYDNIVNGKIKESGIYVIAKGISWEPSEDLNGILNLEIKSIEAKYKIEVSGCKSGVGKYFLILFDKGNLLRKAMFNCSDSISFKIIQEYPEIISKNWSKKPDLYISK